jgi:hypothetical protein
MFKVTWAFALLVVLVLCFGVYVRFAPSDPSRWHEDPSTGAAVSPGPCAVVKTVGAARVACLRAETPGALLALLDDIALASPRTKRLAGNPEDGRITWISRSALWGFPDYTTAQAVATPQGTRLDIHARNRFGIDDMGVNAARLTDWISRLPD